MSSWTCSLTELQKVETRLTSARILPNPLLYVRPSFGCVTLTYVSTEVGCVPEAWEQGRLFCQVGSLCLGFVCLANVHDLVRWHSLYRPEKS